MLNTFMESDFLEVFCRIKLPVYESCQIFRPNDHNRGKKIKLMFER